MPNDNGSWGEIGEKLDLIARLLAYLVAAEHDNLKDRAVALNSLGLAPVEIARICRTTSNTVRVCLAKAKKKPRVRKTAKAKGGKGKQRNG